MDSYHQDMSSIVGERGQVTIPKSLRERLGIEPGDQMEFEQDGAELRLRKVSNNPFEALIGIIKGDGRSVDEIIDDLRGPASAALRKRYRGKA